MKVPPIEATSSAEAGRMSLAKTRAPRRFAVPMACRPATPAPRTSTRAGGTVPAAVMYSGKNRGSRMAASRTQRYPDTRAWELRASMDWAREMRGTSSRAKEVTPASASAWTVGSSDDGEARPTVTAPLFNDRAVSGSRGRTWARTSSWAGSSAETICAPAWL
jgi:hypothetical protein